MRRGRVALVLGLALMMVVAARTLTRAPPRVVRVAVRSEESLGTTTGTPTVCQANEALPSGVSAIRLGLEASFGPRLLVRISKGSQTLTSGSRAAGWTDSSVTTPVKPLDHEASNVKLCLYVPANSGRLQFYGASAAAGNTAVEATGHAFPGRISVEYLASGHGSWWSRALSVARHIGVGHAVSGTWVALLVVALLAAVFALTIGLAWRELP
jgi:hypothetical protein